MDVAPAHGHVYEVEEAHRPGLHSGGREEEHHEKKSVLKKVKDKAKKIKDTIGKKRHGHGEEHGHGAASRSSDEEEEEEEEGYDVEDGEGEQEPEVHGAPMYESEAARVPVSRQEGDMGKEMLAAGQLEDDPGAPKRGTGEAVPGSYQTGVVGSAASPAGGPEPGVIRSFQALSVSDQPGKEREGASASAVTGSHDQFSPESRPAHGEQTVGTAHVAVGGEAGPERRETQEQQPHREKSYTEKISSAIVEKAAHAKDAAVSAAMGSAEYSKKIAETVYEKVAAGGLATGLGSAVAPPLQQKQEEEKKKKDHARSSSAGAAAEAGGADKSAKRVSMIEYLGEKLSPGEEDRALCEVISEAMQKSKEDERDVVREEVEENTGASSPGAKMAPAGKGMVGTIKGAVTSLFGGSHGQAPAQARGEAMDSVPGSSKKEEVQVRSLVDQGSPPAERKL